MPFATPNAAEEAFYDALQRGDLDLMLSVWADSDNVSCAHPGRGLLLGKAAVMTSWQRIMAAPSDMRLEVRHTVRTQGEQLAVHTVHEQIRSSARPGQVGVVLATNAYQRTDQGWRMILHHASPAVAEPDTPPDAKLH